MIEVEILSYLKSQNIGGIGENVHMETPEKEPEEYIRIMRTGGGTSDHMRTATFAIQSIGKTKFRSAEINQKVVKAMEGLNLRNVTECNLNSAYDYTNTSKKQYRYQSVFTLTYYEED